MVISKKCANCGKIKKIEQFYKSRREKYGVEYQCKQCASQKQKSRREQNWEKILNFYGAKCFCCGESIKEFLTIDHAAGDGANHRRQINRGRLHVHIIKSSFPKRFRLACMNCNFAMGVHGFCPHKK